MKSKSISTFISICRNVCIDICEHKKTNPAEELGTFVELSVGADSGVHLLFAGHPMDAHHREVVVFAAEVVVVAVLLGVLAVRALHMDVHKHFRAGPVHFHILHSVVGRDCSRMGRWGECAGVRVKCGWSDGVGSERDRLHLKSTQPRGGREGPHRGGEIATWPRHCARHPTELGGGTSLRQWFGGLGLAGRTPS